MSKRIGTLAFLAALGVFAAAWFSGAAQAGPASVCCDGVVEGNETCDPDTVCPPVSGDGCSANCLIEQCGDGVLTPDTEECDDSNTTAGDGCAADCTCEPEVCGDGIKGCTEECDDGNTDDTDACRNDCTLPPDDDPQEKKQQACINAINKNLAGVIKAQNADNATCIKDVSNGKVVNVADCYGTDAKGKVAKAQGKTTNTDGKKCNDTDEVPGHTYTDPATVNAAGKDEPLEGATLILGAAPNVILKADKPGAKCQQEILKQAGAVSNKWAAEANKAKKKALKGGKNATPPPAPNGAAVATAINTDVGASTALDKAETKATSAITGKCDDTQANAAADCGGATTAAQVAACVIAAAEEGACNAFEEADGIDLNCPTVPVIP